MSKEKSGGSDEPEVIVQEKSNSSDIQPLEKESDIPPRRWSPRIELSEDETERLEKELKRLTNDWQESRGTLEDDLSNWNDLVEGIVSQRDGPWENSSNLHIPLVLIHLMTLHTTLRKILLDIEPVGVFVTNDTRSQVRDILKNVERYVDDEARGEMGLHNAHDDLLWLAGRDGTGIMQWSWARDIKRIVDVEHYADADMFKAEYPNPESANMSKKEYATNIRKLRKGEPISVNVEKDEILYNGPRPEVIELNDFVTFPANATNLQTCPGVGKRFWPNPYDIKKRIEDDIYDKEAAEEILKSKNMATETNRFRQAQNDAEGIEESSALNTYEFYEVIVSFRRDNKKRAMDLLVTYCWDPFKIVSVELWPCRYRSYVRYRLIKRPNRANGRSVIGMLEDINLEVNTQHNQRVDTRSVTTVPTFIGNDNAKKSLDESSDGYEFFPGRWFWLDNVNDITQFKVQPTDMGESLQEESNLIRYGEMLIGDSQLQTGRESATDPNAPAAKTIALIAQSNARIDDYATEFAKGMAESYKVLSELYYRFGDPVLIYRGAGPIQGSLQINQTYEAQGMQIPRELFRAPGSYWRINGAKIGMTRSQQLTRWLMLWQMFQKEEDLMVPTIRHQWKKLIMSLAVPEGGWEDLVKSSNDIKMEMLQRTRDMIVQMVQEKLLPPEALEPMMKGMGVPPGMPGMQGMPGKPGMPQGMGTGGPQGPRTRPPGPMPGKGPDMMSSTRSIANKVAAAQGGSNGAPPAV